MHRIVRSLQAVAMAATLVSTAAKSQDAEQLKIYFVDVEGGGATLFVAPSGESLLIDTGNGGANATRVTRRSGCGGLRRVARLVGDEPASLSEGLSPERDTITARSGRLAQRKSAASTRQRSLVQSQ